MTQQRAKHALSQLELLVFWGDGPSRRHLSIVSDSITLRRYASRLKSTDGYEALASKECFCAKVMVTSRP